MSTLSGRRAVLLVAGREFRVQVRSRSFVISILITLVLFGGIAALGAFVASQSGSNTLGVTAQTAPLRPALEATAESLGADITITEVPDEAAGRAQVESDDLDALFTGSPGSWQLTGLDGVGDDVSSVVATAVQQQALDTALREAGTDPAALAAQSQVATETLEPVDPDRGEQLGVALVTTFLLFFSVSGYGQVVATGVVEEKQSRVVELLLATLRPWQLLAGKVLGIGAVGLLQLVILSAIGFALGTAFGVLTLPAAAAGVLAMVIVWYVIGFTLFAALYAAIASTVSRQEDLNSVIAPMIFVLIIPFVLTVNLLPNDPRNELAAVLSFVPFLSQTIMPARYAMGVAPLWEVLVAAALAVVAVIGVVALAGRVYRNSVLRTGARVSLKDALRGGS